MLNTAITIFESYVLTLAHVVYFCVKIIARYLTHILSVSVILLIQNCN
jgi:hypothetical protein